MANPTTVQQALAVMSDQQKQDAAAALLQIANPGQEVQVITLDLSVAQDANNPLVIGTFRTIYVVSTLNDPTGSAVIQFRPNSRNAAQSPIPLSKKDRYTAPTPWGQGFLHWAQQAGVKVTLVLFAHGDFSSGSQVNTIAGSVALSDGTTGPTSLAAVSVTTAATLLRPADSTRVTDTIENQGSVPIYLGDANVTGLSGAKPGIRLQPGATTDWKNQGALYAVSDSGTVQVAILQLK